jgi:hypothetical protein
MNQGKLSFPTKFSLFPIRGYTKTALRGGRAVRNRISFRLGLNRFDDHPLEQDLERHGVSATLVSKKKFAIAVKNTAIIADIMFIVVAVERQFKLVEAKTCMVFCISLCFFQLADQSVVHRKLLLKVDKQKDTQ